MAFIQILFWKFWILRALILDRLELVAENLLYRQQLMSQQRGGNRPKIEPLDRMLWALVARVWSKWTSALIFVQPATVIGWQRAGWKLFWRWKSKPGPGRPRIDVCVRELIRRSAVCHDIPDFPARVARHSSEPSRHFQQPVCSAGKGWS